MDSLPFKHHFVEFRSRILRLIFFYILFFIISFIFYDFIFLYLSKPLKKLVFSQDSFLYVMSIFEGFVVKFKTSSIVALVISYPFIIYQLLAFIFPGLKKNERKFFIYLVPSTFLLAFTGFFFVYYKILPISIPILLSSSFIPKDIGLVLNFKNSIFYILHFLFLSIFVYQFPILLLLLLHFKIFTRKQLLSSFRYIFIFIFTISAIITPPDVISQISLALPLIFFFFLSYLIASLLKIGDAV